MKKNIQLANYLASRRKGMGVSQQQMARLLGLKYNSYVSRYELGLQLPDLRTLFAYEVIFSLPASILFAGIYAEVKQATEERAKELADDLSKSS